MKHLRWLATQAFWHISRSTAPRYPKNMHLRRLVKLWMLAVRPVRRLCNNYSNKRRWRDGVILGRFVGKGYSAEWENVNTISRLKG